MFTAKRIPQPSKPEKDPKDALKEDLITLLSISNMAYNNLTMIQRYDAKLTYKIKDNKIGIGNQNSKTAWVYEIPNGISESDLNPHISLQTITELEKEGLLTVNTKGLVATSITLKSLNDWRKYLLKRGIHQIRIPGGKLK